MSCPNCRQGRLVEIGLTLQESRVTLRSCSTCETRWWDQDGEGVGLNAVLDLARR